MKNIIIMITATIVTLTITFSLVGVIEKHDKLIRQASKAYEQCIKKQYGVTPSMYYQALGEYPVCE